jgi:predicted alpha/beta superfamily hydrolase
VRIIAQTIAMIRYFISAIFLTLVSTFAAAQRPFVLGVIDSLHSDILKEIRILNIYLPEGYAPDSTTLYPVIYLLDGGADEDFIHVAGLVQYNTFPWVNKIPKSIVVGIANTNRLRDFTFPTTVEDDKKKYPAAGHSDKFIAFIEKELQPYIKRAYKTNNERTLIGQSLGGLLATEMLLKKPSLFNKYIIISPSLWWDNGSLLNKAVPAIAQTTSIYVGVGKEGITPGSSPRVMEVDANVLADKLKQSNNKHIQCYFDYLPDEDHATIGHQAVMNAFKMLK